MIATIDTTSLARDGFTIVPDIINANTIERLITTIAQSTTESHAKRNLLQLPIVAALSKGPELRSVVEPILGANARPVRGLFFDKTPDANWNVAWHQDLSIAVGERIDVKGFGPWSVKAGVVHVQPPREILEQMLTVRLHLDDCAADNGPLRVIAGSHAESILSPNEIARITKERAIATCTLTRGSALVMRPLLLHASSKAVAPAHRRVVHIEYSSATLPAGLHWAAG